MIELVMTDGEETVRLPCEFTGPASCSRRPMRALATIDHEFFYREAWLEKDGVRVEVSLAPLMPVTFDLSVYPPPRIVPNEQIEFEIGLD